MQQNCASSRLPKPASPLLVIGLGLIWFGYMRVIAQVDMRLRSATLAVIVTVAGEVSADHTPHDRAYRGGG